ncbi:MAG: hypothetical protein M0Q91_16955 [Methanoregula sp.]|jgi:hypothetical protein|nr:hypothetical protein [Methanoregula sp.]
MIDPGPVRSILFQLEKDLQNANRVTLEEELNIRTRHIREEITAGLKSALDQYATLEYVTENDPSIKSLPPEVRDSERRTRNLPVRMVVKALEFCQKNPRANGETLKKMQNTKFKGWPAHLDIAVLPNLLKYGQTFMRIAAVQKMIDADPEPVMNDLMSPAPAPAPQPAETPAVDEPGPEETRIDDE